MPLQKPGGLGRLTDEPDANNLTTNINTNMTNTTNPKTSNTHHSSNNTSDCSNCNNHNLFLPHRPQLAMLQSSRNRPPNSMVTNRGRTGWTNQRKVKSSSATSRSLADSKEVSRNIELRMRRTKERRRMRTRGRRSRRRRRRSGRRNRRSWSRSRSSSLALGQILRGKTIRGSPRPLQQKQSQGISRWTIQVPIWNRPQSRTHPRRGTQTQSLLRHLTCPASHNPIQGRQQGEITLKSPRTARRRDKRRLLEGWKYLMQHLAPHRTLRGLRLWRQKCWHWKQHKTDYWHFAVSCDAFEVLQAVLCPLSS
mmetsp:Transcript_76005/g.165837  ORF Transcript_76005/g.165837 Transcript_76005/m.165837 type:complete len:309 (-) Transcript_76005:1123-2049(-)